MSFGLAVIWGLLNDRTCRERWMGDAVNPIKSEHFLPEHVELWRWTRNQWQNDRRWFDVQSNTDEATIAMVGELSLVESADKFGAYRQDCVSMLEQEYNARQQADAMRHMQFVSENSSPEDVAEIAQRFLDCREAVVNHGHVQNTMPMVVDSLLRDWEDDAKGKPLARSIWGIPTLDQECPLIRDGGNVTVIAARPKVGKTAFGCCVIAEQLWRESDKPAMISLEMPDKTLAARVLACMTGMTYKQARYKGPNGIPGFDHARLMSALELIRNKLKCEVCSPNVDKVKALAQRWAAQGVTDIFIDYLQAVQADRKELYRFILQGLATSAIQISRDYGINMHLMAQCNRESAGRAPAISDLSEASFLEQAADIILLFDRPEAEPERFVKRWYCETLDQGAGKGWCLIRKNREGAQKNVNMLWDGPSMRYVETSNVDESMVPPV